MYKVLEKINLSFNEKQINRFNKFIEIITGYNSKVNLVSNNDIKYIFEKHIYDSLALNLFLTGYYNGKGIKLLDIGTGGGFPAVPLALAFENIEITAVDSTKKKIDFINIVKNELEINNLMTLCSRVEELDKSFKNKFDVVTSRAMAELRIILEYAVPYLKTEGYFVCYKSLKADDEIKSAQNALKILNAEIIDKIEYTLPVEAKTTRNLIVIKKKGGVSSLYPRKNGAIRKKPL